MMNRHRMQEQEKARNRWARHQSKQLPVSKAEHECESLMRVNRYTHGNTHRYTHSQIRVFKGGK
jgi:hypothetical protein